MCVRVCVVRKGGGGGGVGKILGRPHYHIFYGIICFQKFQSFNDNFLSNGNEKIHCLKV